VTLTDAGALVALLDADDINHNRCLKASLRLPPNPMLTTWACFTEAMYLLGSVGGFRYQSALWRLHATSRLVLHQITPREMERMAALMEKYQDTPMDLADASLIAVAETRDLRRIFTTDSDFRIYRLANGSALEILPE